MFPAWLEVFGMFLCVSLGFFLLVLLRATWDRLDELKDALDFERGRIDALEYYRGRWPGDVSQLLQLVNDDGPDVRNVEAN